MININLFAGPGVGKSTVAAGLFYQLKKYGCDVEYIQEYAKDLVYGKDYTRLSDQLHIVAEQHHRMHRIGSSADYLIHDSPFILGLVYLQESEHLHREKFTNLVIDMFKSYTSLNIFLERSDDVPFNVNGRMHDEAQSRMKDIEIRALLEEHDIPCYTVKMGDTTVFEIINIMALH